ncbi:hypothetical protein GPJ56_006819 [Histomonas meleagridis]|uniref:uncharacterized protein n=1 Tax=Histomonas meleagridis TaxID=135588 RepID=UPI00355A507A|nr:hypothetical protein GPJ56_006819 [Histomonas meleagridis]KAH0800226.1 hypothetical protein GO595_007338 [Histomonas meleagridis]
MFFLLIVCSLSDFQRIDFIRGHDDECKPEIHEEELKKECTRKSSEVFCDNYIKYYEVLNENTVCEIDYSKLSKIESLVKSDFVSIFPVSSYSEEIGNFSSISGKHRVWIGSSNGFFASADVSNSIPLLVFEGSGYNFKGKFKGDHIVFYDPYSYSFDISDIEANHIYSNDLSLVKASNAKEKTYIVQSLKKIVVSDDTYTIHTSGGPTDTLSSDISIMVSPYAESSYNIEIEQEKGINSAKTLKILFEEPEIAFNSNLYGNSYIVFKGGKVKDIDKLIEAKVGFDFKGDWDNLKDFKLDLTTYTSSKDKIDTSGIPNSVSYEIKEDETFGKAADDGDGLSKGMIAVIVVVVVVVVIIVVVIIIVVIKKKKKNAQVKNLE